MEIESGSFIWDAEKEAINIKKHGVGFVTACEVFEDLDRKIYVDSRHSSEEERMFCVGKVRGRILTVRFTYRINKIRLFGAGFWRKGELYYERENKRSE